MKSTEDHRELVWAWLDVLQPRMIVRKAIIVAYNSTWNGQPWELEADGQSWINKMEIMPGVFNPFAVTHDLGYRAGMRSPFMHIDDTERDVRLWWDDWYYQGLTDYYTLRGKHSFLRRVENWFGSFRAPVYYDGLRLFGGVAWNQNRARDEETARKLKIWWPDIPLKGVERTIIREYTK